MAGSSPRNRPAPAREPAPTAESIRPSVRPSIRLARGGPPTIAVAAAMIGVGLALFLVLDGRRRDQARPAGLVMAPSSSAAFAPPPPLALPIRSARLPLLEDPALESATPGAVAAPAEPVQMPAPSYAPPGPVYEVAVSDPPQRPPPPDLSAAALVIDTTAGSSGGPAAEYGTEAGADGGELSGVRATRLRGLSTTVTQGALIPAVLETPILTSAAGTVRALTTVDVRGFDGTRILVPRGSHVIGDYITDMRNGQDRVLITWNRLIRPDGVSVRLAAPVADPLGQAGLRGQVEPPFLSRFGSAVFRTVVSLGGALAGRYAEAPLVIGVAGPSAAPSPSGSTTRVRLRQGVELSIVVSRDLDFAGVPSWP